MPLLIDGHVISKGADCHPDTILSNYTDLKNRSVKFVKDCVSSKRVITGSGNRLLYVGQREYAVVSNKLNKGQFEYIASDDATTCHIVILTETDTETVAVGHFDGSCTLEGLLSIISKLESIANAIGEYKTVTEINMHIIGGFVDKKKYSEKLFSEILHACSSIEKNIKLELACTYSINNLLSQGQNCPYLLGAGVNIKTLEVIVASFEDRGPDLVLRGVRLMYSKEPNAMHCIHDNENGCVCIHPFNFHCNLRVGVLLNLPDDVYLECCSTSPHCEPKHFISRSKNEMLFAWSYKDKCEEIFYGIARKWYLNEDFKWCSMSSKHSVLPEFDV